MTAALHTSTPESRNEPVPLAYARALLVTAREQGMDVAALLADAAFPFDPLAPPAQPCFVSMEQYSRLCICLFRAMDDESGGIMPASRTRFGSTRLLLYSVIRCQSLAEVLSRAAEFNHCCLERSAERGAWFEAEAGPGLASLNYRPAGQSDGSQEGVLCGLSMWLRLCSWLIGQPIDMVSASCAGPRPTSMHSLRHFFHCPIDFGGGHHRVTFSARHLSAPVVRSEADLKAFLPNAPYHLVIKPVASDGSIASRIQHLLSEDLLEPPGFEALTGMLNMSARTLRRRLEKEGTSYQRIKDNARRDAAITLLCRTRLPVAEIAVRVGFSDPSAFHRSFKKWTGLAPGEYR